MAQKRLVELFRQTCGRRTFCERSAVEIQGAPSSMSNCDVLVETNDSATPFAVDRYTTVQIPCSSNATLGNLLPFFVSCYDKNYVKNDFRTALTDITLN